MNSIFTKIIDREIPAEIVLENEMVIAIKDIKPVAPIHILIIPKKEITSFQAIEKEDFQYLEAVTLAAQEITKKLDITDYRLLTNNGELAGQTIFHLHFHLISGRKLGPMA